jgi:hypothetical protein
MAIDIKTEPNAYSSGYSAIPLRVLSDNVDSDNLKYLINITYSESEYDSSVVVAFNDQVYTKVTTVTDHGYKVGDVLLFYNPVTDNYTGKYTVMGVTATDEFIINLVVEYPIDGTGSYFYKIIPYSMLPDEQYEAKLDLSNTIKDFVTQDLQDTPEIYEAPNTLFEYGLTIGTEYQYTFEFEDNFFITGGTVGFNNTTGTALDVANSPFKIGDRINIQQDLYEWIYDDNTFVLGNLAFTSATIDHAFEIGDLVNVSGQITEQSYNGATTVISIPNSKTIEVNKPFVASTPAEGGSIFGVAVPEYNTLATITDIYYDGSLGYVIETDLPFVQSTPPIGGVIKFADARVSQFPTEEKIDNLLAYNSKITRLEYGFTGNDFDPYVVQTRTFSSNKISSILAKDKSNPYRIEQSTKSWLLVHTDGLIGDAAPTLIFYDAGYNILSQVKLNNSAGHTDFYFPVGIDDVINNSDQTLIVGSSLSTIKDDVVFYDVVLVNGLSTISNYIPFKINTDCSRYELFHLCWKDSFGSWISYPFKYIEKNVTEFERKKYYQKDGRFNTDNDTFGYDTFGRGDTTYFSRSRDKKILNSGWVSEFENVLIKDLLSSPSVMVQTPDGDLLGCTIDTNKQELFKKESDYLFNYTFEITVATNENRF